MESCASLNVVGSVLTLVLPTGETLKAIMPKGEVGKPGRDGISITGKDGKDGAMGPQGQPGRDSQVPGPKGDMGPQGPIGRTPKIRIGSVQHGEVASATLIGDEEMVLNLVLPRGLPGFTGKDGPAGKHGSHEVIDIRSYGNSPLFVLSDWSACHIICDGIVILPALTDKDVGTWFVAKTFSALTLKGLAEDAMVLKSGECAKFVAIPMNGAIRFSKF